MIRAKNYKKVVKICQSYGKILSVPFSGHGVFHGGDYGTPLAAVVTLQGCPLCGSSRLHINKRTNGRTDRQTDRQTDRHADIDVA